MGPLTIDQALTIDEVATRHALGRLGDDLLSLDLSLSRFALAVVDEQTADRVRHGAPVPAGKILRWEGTAAGERQPHMPVRIHDIDGLLIAIGKCPANAGDALMVSFLPVPFRHPQRTLIRPDRLIPSPP